MVLVQSQRRVRFLPDSRRYKGSMRSMRASSQTLLAYLSVCTQMSDTSPNKKLPRTPTKQSSQTPRTPTKQPSQTPNKSFLSSPQSLRGSVSPSRRGTPGYEYYKKYSDRLRDGCKAISSTKPPAPYPEKCKNGTHTIGDGNWHRVTGLARHCAGMQAFLVRVSL